jgi:hypothetical protein
MYSSGKYLGVECGKAAANLATVLAATRPATTRPAGTARRELSVSLYVDRGAPSARTLICRLLSVGRRRS